MEISKRRCDMCEEETEDRYNSIGWIVLELKELCLSKGRDDHRNAKTEYLSEKKLDFCSERCAVSWLRAFCERASKGMKTDPLTRRKSK